MKIRDLTIQDFESFNNLMMELHSNHANNRADIYQKIEKTSNIKAWDFEASLQNDNCILLGAELNSNLVGICVMTIHQPSKSPCIVPRVRGYIEDICVHKDLRHKGIGTALYKEVVQRARKIGAESVELMVWEFNKEAISFYKSLGMSIQSYIMEQKI